MDIQYLLFLQNIRFATQGIFNNFFSYVTTFGEWQIILLIAAALYWCVDKKAGALMALCYTSASMVNQFLKVTFCVYRPWIRSSKIEPIDGAKTTATGYSFPSGHSAGSSSAYGSLAYYYRKYRGIMWFFIILVLFVMFSRNFLGVHTPEDVVVGCCVGGGIALLMGNAFRKWENTPNFDIKLVAVIVGLAVVLLIYASVKSYPTDYVDGKLLVDPVKMIRDAFGDAGVAIGAAVGWLLERRYVKFEIEGPAPVRVLRYMIGIAIFIAWGMIGGAGLKYVVGALPAALMTNIIEMLWIFVGWPMIFKAKAGWFEKAVAVKESKTE
ncbi:MAG: phosphatase PAP2 family protein [Eubacteriaceae bacterium]|nr:phosphatase PAP2 family protein [Eubacteriaceae bacterium]